MDYGRMVLSMLEHANKKDDPADMALLLRAFGFGVANMASWVSDKDDRRELLTGFSHATTLEAESMCNSAQNQAVH